MGNLNPAPTFQWRIAAASVTGAMHQRDGKENQDAFGWAPTSGVGTPLIAAVADGHGNNKSIRSARGARIAVDVAKRILTAYGGIEEPLGSLSALKHSVEERIAQAVARGWRKNVAADLESDPLSAEELDALEEKDGLAARNTVAENPCLAYGSTLLAVLVTAEFILYIQAGDGDIVTVSAGGQASRPLPSDARLFANETTSLSAADAWWDFRVRFQPLTGAPPALILLSTDGYANSFQSDEGFLAVGPDILERARSDGMAFVQDKLPEWLTAATRNGSGDDITLAVIKRSENRDTDSMLERLGACERSVAEQEAGFGHIHFLEDSTDACSLEIVRLEEQLGAVKQLLGNLRRLALAALALAISALMLLVVTSMCRPTAKPAKARRVGHAGPAALIAQQRPELQTPAGSHP